MEALRTSEASSTLVKFNDVEGSGIFVCQIVSRFSGMAKSVPYISFLKKWKYFFWSRNSASFKKPSALLSCSQKMTPDPYLNPRKRNPLLSALLLGLFLRTFICGKRLWRFNMHVRSYMPEGFLLQDSCEILWFWLLLKNLWIIRRFWSYKIYLVTFKSFS